MLRLKDRLRDGTGEPAPEGGFVGGWSDMVSTPGPGPHQSIGLSRKLRREKKMQNGFRPLQWSV